MKTKIDEVKQSVIKNWKDYKGLIKAVKPKKIESIFLKRFDPHVNPVSTNHEPTKIIEDAVIPFVANINDHIMINLVDYKKEQVDQELKKLIYRVASNCTTNMTMGISNVYIPQDRDGKITLPGLQQWDDASASLLRSSLVFSQRSIKAAVHPEAVVKWEGKHSPFGNVKDLFKEEDIVQDMYIPLCTTGSYTGESVVLGTDNKIFGSSIVSCSAIEGTLKQGDFITIENVFEVNKITRESTRYLKTFTVLEDVPSGATEILVSPKMIPIQEIDATVSSLPAKESKIMPVLPPERTYRRNIIFSNDTLFVAFSETGVEKTCVTIDENDGFFSARVIKQNDTMLRVDILGGSMVLFPDTGCVVPYFHE